MRRLNVKLALWLVIVTLVSVVGVHFLHGYQIDRNAEFLRLQAETAKKDGDVKKAIKQYNQYLKYRNDDEEGYKELAALVMEVAEKDKTNRQSQQQAYSTLEAAIRRHPHLEDVRRRLIDYTIASGRVIDALDHIQYLFDHDIRDAGLEYKQALCHLYSGDEDKAVAKLNELVGYDSESQQFKPDPPGKNELPAFELLLQLLVRKADGVKRAEDLMGQMVALNPDSAKAHLSRFNFYYYLAMNGLPADKAEALLKAKADLDRAFELAPDDVDVMVAAASLAYSERDFDKTQKLLDTARQKDPERPEVYLALAQLAVSKESTPAQMKIASGYLEDGLKQLPENTTLMERLAEIQFAQNDLDAVRATCKKMENVVEPEYIRFVQARLAKAEGKLRLASREFEAIRPGLIRSRRYVGNIPSLDYALAQCHEALSQTDQMLEVYRRMLQSSPDSVAARVGEARALQALGRYEQAEMDVKLLADDAERLRAFQPMILQLLLTEQLQKPEDQRDWAQCEAVAELIYIDQNELEKMLLQAEVLMAQRNLPKAREVLTAARKQYPKETRVWLTMVRFMLADEKTRKVIPQFLTLAEKELGDIAALRNERIRQAARDGGDQAPAELARLATGIDKFSEADQIAIQMALATAYLQIRDLDSAKKCWRFVAEKQPENGLIRQVMFDLAAESKDTAGMHEVVKELESKDSKIGAATPLYKYCAASELLYPVKAKFQGTAQLSREDKAAVAEAHRLIDDAIANRAEWSQLWRVRGEIDQLEGNIEGAIKSYQRSLDFNRTGQSGTARRLVQLLYASRRYAEANEAMKYVGQTGGAEIIDRIREDLMISTGGDTDEALELAKKACDDDSKNPSNYTWYGQLLAKAGRTEEAEQAYRQAVEVGPNLSGAWELLIRHLMAAKKKAEAVDAVRQASKSLSENKPALAGLYEFVGENQQAEELLRAAADANPNDLVAIRRLAGHFLNTGQIDKVRPVLEQIIAKAAKSSDPADANQLTWARRVLAQAAVTPSVASERTTYDNVIKATKLIEQNSVGGKLASDDYRAIISLLKDRAEPASRAKALELLGKLQEQSGLLPAEQAVLAQLQDHAGNWTQARDLMLSSLSKNNEDPSVLLAFSRMLLNHEESDDAARWIDRLDEVLKTVSTSAASSYKSQAREVRARLLVKTGKPDEAVQVLMGLVPSPLPQNQLVMLEKVANLMEELGLKEDAEKLLNDYVSQDQRGGIALAAFLGRRGDVEKAFTLLDESRKSQPVVDILGVALETFQMHPDKVSAERIKILESWAKAAEEQAGTDPQRAKLYLASLFELEGRYPEVVKIYRELLANPQTSPVQKAVVKNNLAFILAMSKERPGDVDEALKLVAEATSVLGPNSDLLDTRALSYLAKGDLKQALADLQLAAADAPTTSKYFHLALAEKLSNNLDAARAAIAKAQELGQKSGPLTPMERTRYQTLIEELK